MEHLLDIIVIIEHIEHTFDFCDHFGFDGLFRAV